MIVRTPEELAAARMRGNAIGKANFIRKPAPRTCKRCGLSIAHKRAGTQFCSRLCWRTYVRDQNVIAARLKRPNCIVCGGRIQYERSGVKLSAVTCSIKCSKIKWVWFGRGAK